MKNIIIVIIIFFVSHSLFSQNTVNENQNENFQVVPVFPAYSPQPQKIPNFYFIGPYTGIGFSDFQENMFGRQEFSIQAGFRLMYFFNQTSRSGLIIDVNYERRGGSTGKISQIGETYRANMLTFDLMVGGMISDFYFGAGAFISKKLSESYTFNPALVSNTHSFDSGFVVTTGLMIEATKNTSILVGFDLRISLLPIAVLKGERSKNFAFNFHVGFGFSNQQTLNELREANKIKSREAENTFKNSVHQQIAGQKIELIFDSSHGVPSFIFQGVEFSLTEMKSIFALLPQSGLSEYLDSLKNYQKAMDWLYVAPPTIFFSLIGYKKHMNLANSFAETAFSNLYNQLNTPGQHKEKLVAELLVLTAKKKKQIEAEIKAGFSFIGVRFSKGTNFIKRFKEKNYYTYMGYTYYYSYVHHYWFEKPTFQAGIRYARMFAPGNNTHLRLGFIIDAFTDITSLNSKNIEYFGMNVMLAMKYRLFYIGMGINANFRLRNPGEDEEATVYKQKIIRMVIEPGIVFGKDLKIMAGLNITFHVKKIGFYYSDYDNTGYFKSIPFAISAHLSFGI